MAFDPDRQGWPCAGLASCDGHWFPIGDALVCQCTRRHCRRVIAVATQAPLPSGISRAATDALLSTDLRPAYDWPGCRD